MKGSLVLCFQSWKVLIIVELNVGVKFPPVSVGLPACLFLCLLNPSEQAAVSLNPRLLVCIAAISQGLLILYTHSNTERRTCISGPVLPLESIVDSWQ